MGIRLRPVFAGLDLGLAALWCLVASLNGKLINLAYVALWLVLGFLALRNPIVVVTPEDVRSKNLLGITVRRYARAHPNRFEFDQSGLFLCRPGHGRKRLAWRRFCRPDEWERARQMLSQAEVF